MPGLADLESALSQIPPDEAANAAPRPGQGGVAGMLAAVQRGESLIPDANAPASPPPAAPQPATPAQPAAAAQPATPPEEPPPADPDDDGGKAWLDDMLSEYAPQLVGKYANPDEFFKGMAHLNQTVGRLGQEKGRYEDIGKLVVQDPAAAWEIIKPYLPEDKRPDAAKPTAAPAPAADAPDEVLSEYDYLTRRRPEFKKEWLKQVDKEGNYLPSVADKVDRFVDWKREYDAFQLEHPELEDKLITRKAAALTPKAAPAERNEDLEQVKAKQAQIEQQNAAQQMNLALYTVVNRYHDAVPEDQRWMFAKGTDPREYSDPSKLTPHGQIFWAEMTRRMPMLNQNYTLDDAAKDSVNRVKESLRTEHDKTRPPAPKAGARTQANRAPEAGGSVTSPAKPGVKDFPAGQTLEEALNAALKQDQGMRKKFGI